MSDPTPDTPESPNISDDPNTPSPGTDDRTPDAAIDEETDTGGDDGGNGSGEEDEKGEGRYRGSVAITLAVLAVLGAGIAILGGNAGGKESAAARDATRLATESQAARVIELGANSAAEQVEAEIGVLPLSPGFYVDPEIAAAAGVELDQAAVDQRLAQSTADLNDILADENDSDILFSLGVKARRLTLKQAAVVDERVTWNARASQYETVITVLGVALFLIGFTAVVGRKLRPPLALPGILLALYCIGWSTHIYLKPIPDVSPKTIAATATAETLLGDGETDKSVAAFDEAIKIDDTYLPALQGRSLALAISANPDLLNTAAITDGESETFDKAVADAERALEIGGTEDVTTLTVAGLLSLAAGDLEQANNALNKAVALNTLTPGLQFTLSAVEAGLGNEEKALEWRSAAGSLLGPAKESDRNRALAATYYTFLEYVGSLEGTDTDLTNRLLDETVALESELGAAGDLKPADVQNGTLAIQQLSLDGDELTLEVDVLGVDEDATVTIVGYERPADGASFAQPTELFYVGPNLNGDGLTLKTERNCQPVEYRFDLYVEGIKTDTILAPGVAATC